MNERMMMAMWAFQSGEEVLSLPVVKPPPVDDTLSLVNYFISCVSF